MPPCNLTPNDFLMDRPWLIHGDLEHMCGRADILDIPLVAAEL